jgi:lipid A 4'-phosphatase
LKGELQSVKPELKVDLQNGKDESPCATRDDSGMRRTFLLFLTCSALLGMLFYFVPVIDLWAAGEFFHRHRGFVISNPSSGYALPFLPWLAKIFVSACLLVLAVNAVRRYFLGKQRPVVASNRVIIFLLFTLGIGPGLIVNGILKDHWGRARPFQVTEFGGHRRFTPAFVISDQCNTNCSFVAGDPSMGYFGLAFFFIVRRRRSLIAGAAILAGTLLGLVRMAQGAHFLSDVIFSGVFTFLAAWLLYFLLLRHWPKKQNA